MPLLDVSFMTTDPMLADTFDVRRRLDVIGDNGRTTALPDQLFLKQIGVVTQQAPAALMNAEDGVNIPRRIFIASRFQFISIAPGRKPDEVTWNGVVYTVQESFPYSRYGRGFYEAICEYRGVIPPLQ